MSIPGHSFFLLQLVLSTVFQLRYLRDGRYVSRNEPEGDPYR